MRQKNLERNCRENKQTSQHHADMRLHPEEILASLRRLIYLRIALHSLAPQAPSALLFNPAERSSPISWLLRGKPFSHPMGMQTTRKACKTPDAVPGIETAHASHR